MAPAALSKEFQDQGGPNGVSCRDHFGPRELAFSDQPVEFQFCQDWQEDKEASCMSGERFMRNCKCSYVSDGIGLGSWFLRALVVCTTRKTGKAFCFQNFLNGRNAEGISPRAFEYISDVIDGEVLLSEFDDTFSNGIFLGLGLGSPSDIFEKITIHVVAKAPAE